ncbi:unnamed protein product [Candida verbasci]|uniref:Complex I-B15 n=1 Tax=Candida verbasci TaxID=1227364 RepID=A0A9W4TYS1_9ASCO|nr:unnamed protein product [Candida verbasci]
MAGTLHPDPQFEKFNTAKEKLGHYFRFKPRSVLFNIIYMGIIPIGLTISAYNVDGKKMLDRFRHKPILNKEYVPRDKDL